MISCCQAWGDQHVKALANLLKLVISWVLLAKSGDCNSCRRSAQFDAEQLWPKGNLQQLFVSDANHATTIAHVPLDILLQGTTGSRSSSSTDFCLRQLHWPSRRMSLHQSVLNQQYHCSQNVLTRFQLHYALNKKVLFLSVTMPRAHCNSVCMQGFATQIGHILLTRTLSAACNAALDTVSCLQSKC